MSEYLVSKLSELLGKNEYFFTQDVIKFLGWFNILLVLIALSQFLLRRVNKYAYGNKNVTIKTLLKPITKIHPYVGVLLLISAYVHGELALGSLFRMHTGPLAWWIVVVMMLVALIGKKYRIKPWLKVHRSLAVLFIVAVLLHLFVRNLFSL
jgi:hypothetical protein